MVIGNNLESLTDHRTLVVTEASRQMRRLQLSGGSTFVISLPKVWVEDMSLKVGDGVMIMRNPNRSLTFIPDRGDGTRETSRAAAEIGPKDSDESIRRKIIAMYLAGYKYIRIVSKGVRMRSNQVNVIRNLIRSTMIGTEIVESDSESMLIQILTRLPELSFDVVLRRMHLMTTNMHREAIEALAACNTEYAQEIIGMDDEIDRFALYMLRNLTIAVQNAGMLQEMGLKKPSDCLGYRTVISRIERIADHAALIAKRVKYLDGTMEEASMKSVAALSEDALKLFERAIESLAKCSYQMAEGVADEVPVVVRRQEEIMFGMDDRTKNSSVIKFVLEDIRRTAEYSSDIAEVVMDKNIQSVVTEE